MTTFEEYDKKKRLEEEKSRRDYDKKRLDGAKYFIANVLRMQAEVEAGAELNKHQKQYEKMLNMPLPTAQKVTEVLYTDANNGHKELFTPIILDLVIAYEGFKKWPFTETAERKNADKKTLDSKIEQKNSPINKDAPLKIIRGRNTDYFGESNKEKETKKEQPKEESKLELKITHGTKYYDS